MLSQETALRNTNVKVSTAVLFSARSAAMRLVSVM